MVTEIKIPQPVRFSLLRILIEQLYRKLFYFSGSTGTEYTPAAVSASAPLQVAECGCWLLSDRSYRIF